jgi:hypothetical protein
MIKDRIITLNNNHEFYILEEMEYNQKKYVLAAECDTKTDTIEQENLTVMEIKLIGDNIAADNIVDDNLAGFISAKLLEKLKNV